MQEHIILLTRTTVLFLSLICTPACGNRVPSDKQMSLTYRSARASLSNIVVCFEQHQRLLHIDSDHVNDYTYKRGTWKKSTDVATIILDESAVAQSLEMSVDELRRCQLLFTESGALSVSRQCDREKPLICLEFVYSYTGRTMRTTTKKSLLWIKIDSETPDPVTTSTNNARYVKLDNEWYLYTETE